MIYFFVLMNFNFNFIENMIAEIEFSILKNGLKWEINSKIKLGQL